MPLKLSANFITFCKYAAITVTLAVTFGYCAHKSNSVIVGAAAAIATGTACEMAIDRACDK